MAIFTRRVLKLLFTLFMLFSIFYPARSGDYALDLEKAREYTEKKQWKQALTVMEAIVSQGADDPQWFYISSLIHFGLGRGAQGFSFLAKAISLEPDNHLFHYQLAFELERVGQFEKAEDSYKMAVLIDPTFIQGIEGMARMIKARYDQWVIKTRKSDDFKVIQCLDSDIKPIIPAIGTLLYMENGDHENEMGIGELPDGRMTGPQSFCIRPEGELIITDNIKSRLLFFDKDGAFLGDYGKKGRTKGDINKPFDIIADPLNYLYLLDDPRMDIRLVNYGLVNSDSANNGPDIQYKWDKLLNDPNAEWGFIQANRLSFGNDMLFIYGLTPQGFKTRGFTKTGTFIGDRSGQVADERGYTWKVEQFNMSVACFDQKDDLHRLYQGDFKEKFRALGILGVEEDMIYLVGLLKKAGLSGSFSSFNRKGGILSSLKSKNPGRIQIIALDHEGTIQKKYEYDLDEEGQISHAKRLAFSGDKIYILQVEKGYTRIKYFKAN